MESAVRKVISLTLFLLILQGIFIVIPVVHASPKSLYLVANHHTQQFDAWEIKPDGTATSQASYLLSHATDPAGIAIDESSNTLFITSEFSGGVEMVDATTMTPLGVSTGPRDLAGIAVDDAKDIVYTVRRYSNTLYAYDWNPVARTLTLKSGYPISLPGCSGAFGIELDEIRGVLWVADGAAGLVRAYDVNTWIEDTSKSFTPSHKAVDIAVDRWRGFVYTVSMSAGAWVPLGCGSRLLSKYDLTTRTETTGTLIDQGVGVAVDEVTGLVYVTLSPYSRGLSRGNLEVWDTSTSPWTNLQTVSVSGSPAGICIPQEEVAYNPLGLSKDDGLAEGEYIAPGEDIVYEICYDNTKNTYDVHNAKIVDELPEEASFISATDGGTYDSNTHTVIWNIGTLPAGAEPRYVLLAVHVPSTVAPGSTIVNYATIDSDETLPTTISESTDVCPLPGEIGLEVVVTATPPEDRVYYQINDDITFTVTVTNLADVAGTGLTTYYVKLSVVEPEEIQIDIPAGGMDIAKILPSESKSTTFYGKAVKAGDNVEVIVNAWGYTDLSDEVGKIRGRGSCTITIYDPEAPKPDWSFAIIADLHIGYKIPDYDGETWDDSGLGENYDITKYLENAVDKILTERGPYSIKFVAVLGDFADTAEKSEFLKAREILNRLNDPNGDGDTSDGIPYIPVIGDHDQWPYTQKEGIDPDNRRASVKEKASYAKGDEWFNEIFWGEGNAQNLNLLEDLFGYRPQKAKSEKIRRTYRPWITYNAFLQNRYFSYGGMNFILLDFNPRAVEPGSFTSPIASHYPQTKEFLRKCLEDIKNKPELEQTTIIFSHHPLYLFGGFLQGELEMEIFGADVMPIKDIDDYVSENGLAGKVYNFAGHTHCNRPAPDESINVAYYATRAATKLCQKAVGELAEWAVGKLAGIEPLIKLYSMVKDIKSISEVIEIFSKEENLNLLEKWDDLLFEHVYKYKVIETEPVSQIEFEWPEWIPCIGGKPICPLTEKSIRIVQVKNDELNYSTVLKPKEVKIRWPFPDIAYKPWASYPEPNKEITFTAHFTTYHGFTTSFDWDFGDGSYASGLSVTHSYSQDGEYNVTLTVTTKNLVTGEEKIYTVTSPVYVHSKHVISSLPSNLNITSLLTEEDLTQVPKNTYQPALIAKSASEEVAIVEFGVHFEEATEDIDLSTLVANVDLEEGKSVIYMHSWPEEIGEDKVLFIPSTGVGTVYICLDATSLEEVSLENADVILNVGETKDGITVTITFYNGREYYLVSGVTGTGGGELKDNIPPTTTLDIGEPKYVDPTENIYVSSATPFTLTAEDNPGGTGVASTAYKIYNSTYDSGWVTYTGNFSLPTCLDNGPYLIAYNSTDNLGNVEAENIVIVILRNPLVDTWMTDSDFREIESFRAVFTPYRNTGLYKLTSTNPGQFYFNILVNNTWPEPLNITIAYSIDDNFTFKGARPIHVYADLLRTIDITANCAFLDNTITVYNVPSKGIAYVTIHLDYVLKGTKWTKSQVDAWYSEHTSIATADSITSSVTITDPITMMLPVPAYLILLMVILPSTIMGAGLLTLLKYGPLTKKRRKED